LVFSQLFSRGDDHGWRVAGPFLKGAVDEVRDRAPGMMLLIAMAITVAWESSMASSLGWFDLEFWWGLAALVTIMLLGHWQEMKAIGHAQVALAALAALLLDMQQQKGPSRPAERTPLRFAAHIAWTISPPRWLSR
jgi:P-type Cu2+ transporter